jgi:hypothetical protein
MKRNKKQKKAGLSEKKVLPVFFATDLHFALPKKSPPFA